MALTALVEKDEIRAAYKRMMSRLKDGAQIMECTLGWQGGNQTVKVFWRSDERYWVHGDDRATTNRYWCCFGTTDPHEHSMMSIVCEINPPFEGNNQRAAGMFVRDDNGKVYLAHSGKIGGGCKGIGKAAFLDYYRGSKPEMVRLSDGRLVGRILIGALDGKRFTRQVAEYVREVARFKKAEIAPVQIKEIVTQDDVGFSPEFQGARTRYEMKGSIESRCDHGLIVSALHNELQKKKLIAGNDRLRDLFVAGKNGVDVLFEVKTEATTTCIYEAVGQLMIHGSTQKDAPMRVLVLPVQPNSSTLRALDKLSIRVMTYAWNSGVPKFTGLNKVIQ